MSLGAPLVDAVHGWTYNVAPPVKSPWLRDRYQSAALDLRIALRKAHRFTLDDAFVREIVRRTSVCEPARMLAVSDLANLPFEKVFIEYDNSVRIKAQKDAGTMKSEKGEVATEDRGTAGWLLERRFPANPALFSATYFALGDKHSPAADNWAIGAASYVMNLDGYDTALPERFESIAQVAVGMPWGYAYQETETGDFTYKATEELTRRGLGGPEPRFMRPLIDWAVHNDKKDEGERIREFLVYSLYEGRGDLRFITTMLAMLNHVPTTYVYREAKGFHRARLRNVPYLDNRLLTIHCGRRRIVNVVDHAIKNALGSRHHKRHEVRGFWRDIEYGKAHGCDHLPMERDGNYCLCGKCGHLLRWIEHHERGDANLGWVTHDYNVKV